MEAYDLVRGLDTTGKAQFCRKQQKFLSLFTKATEVDPNYARAFA